MQADEPPDFTEMTDVIDPPDNIIQTPQPSITATLTTDNNQFSSIPMDLQTFHEVLVSLLTCSECGRILEDPVTLHCGNTLCRTCLPGTVDMDNCDTPREREPTRSNCPYFWNQGSRGPGGGYPNHTDSSTEKWIPPTLQERFDCPFHECERKQHSRDVTSNYILQKILSTIPSLQSPPVYSEKPQQPPVVSPADICNRIQSELDCQICYLLLHDPLTTPCGHTFCRPCLLRTSDHATHPVCPTCRSPVLLPTPQNSPTNILLDKLIHTLFPAAAAERAASETSERHSRSSGINTPIFVCTLALPSVTCFLHIFEPRYRLMLRRCMAGDRRFGMVLPRSRIGARYIQETTDMQFVNPVDGAMPPQMNGSRPHFMQYGTILEIKELQMLPDGRSLVETVGRERFKIHEWSVRDGYVVARTSPLPDLEPTIYVPPPSNLAGNLTTSVLANTAPETMTTNQLIYLTRCFVQSLRSVTWLSARLRDNELEDQLARLDSRGDAVKFAWWVSSKMPMEEGEAYSLLLQTGVRELYCVLGSWIGEMERQSWYSPARGCRIS